MSAAIATRPANSTGWRLAAFAVVAVPPLVLAAVGVTHPMALTPDSAAYWRDMHIWLLPVFPAMALAPWLLVRISRTPAPLRWVAAALGYAYAVGYTGLDVLAGIGAGAVEARTADHDATDALFHYAGDLAMIGVYAFLLATVLAAVTALVRGGLGALPGAVLVVGGGFSFIDSHILWPRGVFTMVALAAGWSALLWAVLARPSGPETPQPQRPPGDA